MAEPQKPGRVRNFFGRVGDAVTWGNNYNRDTGKFTATPGQIIGGVGSRLLNFAAPGVGTLVNLVGNGANGVGPMRALDGLLGGTPTATAAPNIGPVTRQQIGFPGQVLSGNVGVQPAMIPTMPTVQAQAPWTGSLANSNPFGGGYGSNLGLGGGGRPIGGNLSYGGGRAGYNNGAGAGTGFGGASFANDSWGNVASGFGVGSSAQGSRMPDVIARYARQ